MTSTNDLEIAYLKVKSEILENMSVDDFKDWIYLDEFGIKQATIQHKEALIKALEKEERYDLLITLKQKKK